MQGPEAVPQEERLLREASVAVVSMMDVLGDVFFVSCGAFDFCGDPSEVLC